jgi:hypothetical protein
MSEPTLVERLRRRYEESGVIFYKACADRIEELEQHQCPCLIADKPCMDRCSCVNRVSSRGCLCCCKYGSEEQRKAAANRLVGQSGRIEELEREVERLSYDERGG